MCGEVLGCHLKVGQRNGTPLGECLVNVSGVSSPLERMTKGLRSKRRPSIYLSFVCPFSLSFVCMSVFIVRVLFVRCSFVRCLFFLSLFGRCLFVLRSFVRCLFSFLFVLCLFVGFSVAEQPSLCCFAASGPSGRTTTRNRRLRRIALMAR